MVYLFIQVAFNIKQLIIKILFIKLKNHYLQILFNDPYYNYIKLLTILQNCFIINLVANKVS